VKFSDGQVVAEQIAIQFPTFIEIAGMDRLKNPKSTNTQGIGIP